ncbi:MAG: galactose oxidase [Acidobacteria bacterium]|jgi:N-acetylneuraminic acid mutarotase|nr:galactose oxidase [Acidobacteriota bacterium]
MKPTLALALLLTLAALLYAADSPFEPLPAPVSNNAVAVVKSRGDWLFFSFMGMGPKKTWEDVTNAAHVFDANEHKWLEIRPVPGTAGRLGAVAVGAREHVFLLGGYIVDAQGNETTVADVNAYQPLSDRWFRGADIPVPVDDSVAGLYRDRYIYLVGGWSKKEAVRNVQVYDTQKNIWTQATPLPGTPVFGHAGALVEDTIVYVDGAYPNPSAQPKYIASEECWIGKIDRKDMNKIQWTKLPNHPGSARYRIAAGGSERDHKIYFTGGTDNPYNYNGVGYDGKPAQPSPVTFAFDLKSGKWETVNDNTPNPTMDHRNAIATTQGLVVIGGMEKDAQVSAKVVIIPTRSEAKGGKE